MLLESELATILQFVDLRSGELWIYLRKPSIRQTQTRLSHRDWLRKAEFVLVLLLLRDAFPFSAISVL